MACQRRKGSKLCNMEYKQIPRSNGKVIDLLFITPVSPKTGNPGDPEGYLFLSKAGCAS